MPDEQVQDSLPTRLSDKPARLFLAIPIPEQIQKTLHKATAHYINYTASVVPLDKWHLTLLFLGDQVENPKQYLSRLTKDLPQAFVPTVTLTHVGRGFQRGQLWAYAHPTPSLIQLRSSIIERLQAMRFPIPQPELKQEFVPHIRIANLLDMSRGFGLADYATPITFAAHEVRLYQSFLESTGSQYQLAGKIALTH